MSPIFVTNELCYINIHVVLWLKIISPWYVLLGEKLDCSNGISIPNSSRCCALLGHQLVLLCKEFMVRCWILQGRCTVVKLARVCRSTPYHSEVPRNLRVLYNQKQEVLNYAIEYNIVYRSEHLYPYLQMDD